MNTRKLLAFLLCLLASVSTLSPIALAQGANASLAAVQARSAEDDVRAGAEAARIERLVGLARVWGTVKYFHPFLAYREIDWDKALVEAIPRVNAAKTAQEYQAAVNQMLAVLNDKSTRAEIEPPVPTGYAFGLDETKFVRTESGLLIIEAAQIAITVGQDTSKLGGFVASINQALPNAIGVVFDWRAQGQLTEFQAFYFENFMRQTLTGMLDTNVVLGASRHRMHSGYPTQTASGASFYYSGLVGTAPQTLPARGKTKTPPIAFIVNHNSPPFAEIMSGMQASNHAVVIQDGDRPQDSSSGTYTMDLPDRVKVRIRTLELINPDGSVDLQPDAIMSTSNTEDASMIEARHAVQHAKPASRKSRPAAVVLQVSQKDKPYAEMQFPNVEYRLLALFRYWNVVNYFFPYKNLIGDSWNTVLQRFIPKFEANQSTADYQLTVFELATEMHDSHAVVRNASAAAEKLYGFQTPAFIRYLENQAVITKVLDDKAPVKVGDVVLTIDGAPVEKRREFLSRYIGASTPQSLMLRVHSLLLAGPKDRIVKLRVRGPNGKERDVELARSIAPGDPKYFAAMSRSGPVMKLLPQGYGYVDLGRLEVGEVEKMFEMIKNAPAVIFDMRGYPTGSAWEIAPRLTERKNVIASLFSRSLLDPSSLTSPDYADHASYAAAQKLPDAKGSVYKGKVVTLINEDAISRAEHACLFFEAATDVTFVGTPTQGANGDVTLMVLPGNLPISFSGHDIRHADGRQLQRLGIQPHVKVAPTIRGLIEGRDEILDAAVKHLQKTLSAKARE
jgi:C-terminal processing protease CtpA/Prc